MGTKFTLIGSGLAGGLPRRIFGRRGIRGRISTRRRADPRAGNFVGGRSSISLFRRVEFMRSKPRHPEECYSTPSRMPGRMIHRQIRRPAFYPLRPRSEHYINSIGRAALNTTVIEAALRYAKSESCSIMFCTESILTPQPPYLSRRGQGEEECSTRPRRTTAAAGAATDQPVVSSADAIIGRSMGPFRGARSDAGTLKPISCTTRVISPTVTRNDNPAGTKWWVANGKGSAPHLAAQEFHDDCAANLMARSPCRLWNSPARGAVETTQDRR